MTPWRTFAFLSVTFFMLLLDFSIVNVALPALQRDFAIPISSAQWVMSTYAIALAGFLLFAGRCCDLYDRRAMFAGGLAVFTAASLVGGLAPTFGVLVAMRALQGLGAAIVTPSAMAILMDVFAPGDARNRMLGLWNTVGSAGIAAGMLAGGILVQYFGWRAVFFVNVPVGLVVLCLTPFVVPADARERTATRLDVTGAVLLTAGLTLAILAIESIADRSIDWDTWVELGLAIGLLCGFVVVERRARSPLIPARLFAYKNLVPGTVNTFFEVAAYVAAFIFASVLAQRDNHYSPLATGLAFLPSSVAITVIAGPLSAPAIKRIGVRGVGFFGGIALMAGCLILLLTRPGMPYWQGLLPGTVLIGFGGMWTYQAGIIAGLADVASADQGLASGLINTSVQAASSIGVGLAAALSMAYGLPWAFGVALVAAACAFVTGTFVLRPIAAEHVPDAHYIPMGKGVLPRHTLSQRM